MDNQPNNTNPPLTHRVAFARLIGTGEKGMDRLGYPREIGDIWARKDGKKGSILKLDHMPLELTKHEGVLFIFLVEDN